MMAQDIILAAGNAVFVLAMLPAVCQPETRFPRVASVTTGLILATFSVTHFTMGMPLAASMNAAGAGMWAFVAARRST